MVALPANPQAELLRLAPNLAHQAIPHPHRASGGAWPRRAHRRAKPGGSPPCRFGLPYYGARPAPWRAVTLTGLCPLECGGSTPLSFFGLFWKTTNERKRRRAAALQNVAPRP